MYISNGQIPHGTPPVLYKLNVNTHIITILDASNKVLWHRTPNDNDQAYLDLIAALDAVEAQVNSILTAEGK